MSLKRENRVKERHSSPMSPVKVQTQLNQKLTSFLTCSEETMKQVSEQAVELDLLKLVIQNRASMLTTPQPRQVYLKLEDLSLVEE